ncbi:hypothetical protein BU26DRAFT_585519 [Trematosphaeria pertusa]|uniref:Uncharacterized protein n=1 Tax=Trematosphaeria pertusa TaxID=390896 RepID=A0A6A6HVY9_9PLEO|nr:uncharacterized protein BU26DRAFT_585519 [Trematosphaeria pertusa]KAF2241902.1 hypothetical protein BU26DRAFT_585519 [Trematosphaeria pertusa]
MEFSTQEWATANEAVREVHAISRRVEKEEHERTMADLGRKHKTEIERLRHEHEARIAELRSEYEHKEAVLLDRVMEDLDTVSASSKMQMARYAEEAAKLRTEVTELKAQNQQLTTLLKDWSSERAAQAAEQAVESLLGYVKRLQRFINALSGARASTAELLLSKLGEIQEGINAKVTVENASTHFNRLSEEIRKLQSGVAGMTLPG